MYQRLAYLPRRLKILIMLVCDILLLPLALYSAIALRLGMFFPPAQDFWWLFLLLPVITVPLFVFLGLYRSIVRYMDDKIILTVIYGVSLSVLLLTLVIFFSRPAGIPRSSIIIYWVIAIAYIGSSRFMARGVLRTLEQRGDRRQKVAIYGAGRSGLQTALALLSGPEYRPVVFFDDEPDLQGTNVAGIRVFDPKDAFEVMEEHECRQLLIAMPSATRLRRREIIQRFEKHDLVLKTLPGMGELVGGTVRIEDIREVGVEDLLGRDPVPPYTELIEKCVRDRVVMVTGAGGSIGADLCKQIALNGPRKILLYELNEFALYKITQDLERYYPSLDVEPILGDVLNGEHLIRVLKAFNVDTVYHAAAYKHVPLVESNITQGIQNNSLGTLCAAQCSIDAKVKNFVLISTDKAVRPTNVMGASKRLAELVLQALAKDGAGNTRFTMVRFGNVLGSSGSVVPLFKEQIRSGGPITVTHPDVTRYFMTIPEAAQLVLQAGAMGQGGDVFVLDMGEPVKIVDLAKKMIELSGLTVVEPGTVHGDISIEFSGLRPGEKLYEELLIGDNVEKTEHPRIMRATENMIELSELMPLLDKMRDLCKSGDCSSARTLLGQLVREYNPS